MSTAELTTATAAGLAALIASGEVSAAEVVEAHLGRIEAVDGTINAIVALDGDRALAAAADADAALARGERRGPLHGVPFTAKDNLSAAGLPMAIGAPERAGMVADFDATAVARLRSAGAILLGKTNCPPYGGGIETDNPVHGRTSNPYDPARTPGGSSGGEAAIVAAGGSPCGLGTDSGASIRLPAHFCGLAAIKPSAGRVPLTGVLDDEGHPAQPHRLAGGDGALRHVGRRSAHRGPARRRAVARRRGAGRGAADRGRARRLAAAAAVTVTLRRRPASDARACPAATVRTMAIAGLDHVQVAA